MAAGGVGHIKNLWQQGEELSLGGKHSEAILQFQRAKRLLETESQTLYGSAEIPQGGAGNKLMGDIMSRLADSINRDVKLINANGVHALGLKRGFSKVDVKKAYRAAALKYHPDKNKDCDTSCIFAAIQSGYEKLNATLDAGEVPSQAVPTARRNTYASAEPGKKEEDQKHGPNYFYSSHKDVGRRDRARNNPQKPSPYTFDHNRAAPNPRGGGGRDASPRVSPRGTKGDGAYEIHERRQREKAASALSSDHLKLLLKQFGFTDRQVASMSREQLVKRYVGVSEAMNNKEFKKTSVGDRGSSDRNTPPTGRRPTYGDDQSAPSSTSTADATAGGATKPTPRDREKEFLARERAGLKERGKRQSTYRTPSVSYHDPEDEDDQGKFKLPPDFIPSAPGMGKDGGLEGFEAMAKAWAEEWSKQMHKEMAREARQYSAQEHLEKLEKEIGVNKPSRGGVNSGKRSRATGPTASSSAARDKGGDGNYEYTHIPESMKSGKEKADPNYKSPFASNHYTKKYEKAKKEELLAAEAMAQAREKKRRDKERERESQDQAGKPTVEKDKEGGEDAASRAQVADALRKERAAWMEERLPSMSMRELRNICSASGVVWVKGDSEDDVAAKLARHYGVKVPPPRAQAQDSTNRPSSGGGIGGVSAAEAALKSKFYVAASAGASTESARTEEPDSKRKKSPRGTSQKVEEQGGGNLASTHASDAAPPAPAKYISTKQLAELEKRVLGNGRVRRARPSSSDGQIAQQTPQPVEEDGAPAQSQTVEPLRDLGSILSSAARQAAEEEGNLGQEASEDVQPSVETAAGIAVAVKGKPERESKRLLRAVYGADNSKKPRRRAKSKEGPHRKSPRVPVPSTKPPVPGPVSSESSKGTRGAGLTIEIEDPQEFMSRQEQVPQPGMTRTETTESDIGLDPEEEGMVGWNDQDLVARLEARGWDMDALRPASQRGSPKSPSGAPAATKVKGQPDRGKIFHTMTSSQEAIHMRAYHGSEGGKREEEDGDDEGGDAKDTSFHSNISSAGAVTIDSGNTSARVEDGEASGIKFGTGMLGSDDEDEEEEEESDTRVPAESDSDVMEESVPEASPRSRGGISSSTPSFQSGEELPDLDSVPKGPKVFEVLLRQQEAEEEMRLRGEATAGDVQVQPGRIRRRGGSNTNSGNPSAENSSSAGKPASPKAGSTSARSSDLRLNLAAILKDREVAVASEDGSSGQGEGDVQVEVDFWVNSARSDASGRNTYRELEAAMRQDEGKREGARGSPQKKQSPLRGTERRSSTVDDVSAKLLEKYSGAGGFDRGSLSPAEVNQQLAELQRRIQSDKNRDYLDDFYGEIGDGEENSRATLNKMGREGGGSPSKLSPARAASELKEPSMSEFFYFG